MAYWIHNSVHRNLADNCSSHWLGHMTHCSDTHRSGHNLDRNFLRDTAAHMSPPSSQGHSDIDRSQGHTDHCLSSYTSHCSPYQSCSQDILSNSNRDNIDVKTQSFRQFHFTSDIKLYPNYDLLNWHLSPW